MADLTAGRLVDIKMWFSNPEGLTIDFPVVASDIIYEGALVGVNAAGFLVPANGTDAVRFTGIALQKADNSSGSAGDITCQTLVEPVFEHAISSLVQADVGTLAYASDDNTMTLTSSSNLLVGRVLELVSAGIGIIRSEHF